MPLELQVKLLRVLQERELQRLGAPSDPGGHPRWLPRPIQTCPRESAGQIQRGSVLSVERRPARHAALRDRPGDIPLLWSTSSRRRAGRRFAVQAMAKEPSIGSAVPLAGTSANWRMRSKWLWRSAASGPSCITRLSGLTGSQHKPPGSRPRIRLPHDAGLDYDKPWEPSNVTSWSRRSVSRGQ